MHEPDLNVVRLEFGDPIGQLRHLKKLIFVLQIHGANPKRVGDQTTKTTEGDCGEGEHRRRILQRLDSRESELVAVPVQRKLDARGGDEKPR